jgi:hypothetical protein
MDRAIVTVDATSSNPARPLASPRSRFSRRRVRRFGEKRRVSSGSGSRARFGRAVLREPRRESGSRLHPRGPASLRILDFPDSSRELRAEGAGSPEQLGQLRGHVCFLRSPERGGDEAVRTYQGRRPDNSPGHRVRVSPPRRDIVRGQLSGVSAGDQVFGGDSSRALGEKIQWATACAVTCWFA